MKPEISANIHIEKIGGNGYYFILDPDVPSWVVVNEDGLEILKLCNGIHSARDITMEIVNRHNIGESKKLEAMVESFLQSMYDNKIFWKSEPSEFQDNSFRGIALEITKQCNLDCKHCYLAAGNASNREMTFVEIKQLLNEVKDAGGISVALGGGEPLMRDDWAEIIEYCLSLGLLVSFGTNGTLIDQRTAELLSSFKVKIQVSLDGASAETHDLIRGKGSFKKAINGIDKLIGAGANKDLLIAFTPMKPNIHEVPDIISFALNRKIPVVQFPPLTSSGRAKKQWDKLRLSIDEMYWFWDFISNESKRLKGRLDLLADCFSININNSGKQHRCSIGTQFRIDPSGNVYPCQCFHFGTKFCLGNIRETRFEEIVRGEKIKRIKKTCFTRPKMIPECQECKWINICGSGCMGNIYEQSGTIFKPESCEVRKKWIEKLFEVKFNQYQPS